LTGSASGNLENVTVSHEIEERTIVEDDESESEVENEVVDSPVDTFDSVSNAPQPPPTTHSPALSRKSSGSESSQPIPTMPRSMSQVFELAVNFKSEFVTLFHSFSGWTTMGA